ncbi:MAG: response regulator [Nitrospinota bacterium]|nr:response regulator [Nitrospinota bacterium]
MPKTRDFTIKQKLGLIIGVTTVVALLLASVSFILYQRYMLRQTIVQDLSSLAEITGNNNAASLAFMDTGSARDTLGGLSARPSIEGAAIYSADGELFVKYIKMNADFDVPEYPGEDGQSFSGGRLILARGIIFDGERIGTFFLAANMDELNALTIKSSMTVLLVMFISLIASMIVSSRLQGLISNPVAALSSLAISVSESKDYSVRAKSDSRDEFGDLMNAFNEMLEQIQSRDQKLREHGKELEKEVEERTRELNIANTNLNEELLDRRKAEQALARTLSELETIMNANPDILYVVNMEGKLIKWNNGLAMLTGLGPDKLMLRPITEFIHEDDRDIVMRRVKDVFQNGEATVEARFFDRNGDLFPYYCNGIVLRNEKGEVTGFTGTGRDISILKETELELRRAKDSAEEATRLKDKFVSLVSHDLKGPLGSLLGFLELIKRDSANGISAESGKYLSIALDSGEKMLTLIDDLLNISRLKTGNIMPHYTFNDLHIIMLKILSGLAYPASLKGVTIQNDVRPGIRVYADKQLLQEVLQNLISNAVKFCNQGDTIRIFLPSGNGGQISVADTGQGIAPERIGKLFNYEEKTSTIGTAGETGTGLGLPLSMDIIKAHKGNIAISSEVGIGSTFTVSLPIVKPVILLVEDDINLMELVKFMLEGLDVFIMEARDGQEALDILSEKTPHLILSDIMMPRVDGMELLEKVRNTELLKDIPFIVMTTSREPEVSERAFQLGADDFLVKPVTQNEMIPRIKRFIL